MCMHCTRRQFIGATTLDGMALATGHLAAEPDPANPPPESESKIPIHVIIAGKPSGKSWGLSEEDRGR